MSARGTPIAALAALACALPQAAAQSGPPPDQAAIQRALRDLREGKDAERNVALLRAAVEQAADPGRFALDLGIALLRERQFPPAQSFLEIARERRPADGVAALQLGTSHVMQYHYAEAFEHLSAAEALLPEGPRPVLHQYLSMVLVGLQRMEESEARALRAIEEAAQWNATAPPERRLDAVDFELNLVNVYEKWMRWDDALAVLDRMPEPPEPKDRAKAWLVRAQVLDAKGDDEGALAAFTRQRELAPEDAKGAYEFALFHVRRNRPAEARPHLERAVALDPAFESARLNLARVLTRLGEREAGESHMAIYRRLYQARIHAEAALSKLRLELIERTRR